MFPAVLILTVVSFKKWKKILLVFLALSMVVAVYDKGIVPATGATPISRRAAYSVPFQQTAKKWKKILLVFLALSMVVAVYDKGIVPATGATPISRRAAYSVPFQQTAKYLRDYPQDVTEEEYNVINQVLRADVIAERYNPRISDPVKNTFRNEASSKAIRDYLKVWFRMFWKHQVLRADVIAERYNPRISDPVKNTFRNEASSKAIRDYLKVWFRMFWKHQVLRADVIAERYNPRISDPVKNTFRNEASSKAIRDYLKVWFRMFWKHPGIYLEAFLQQCSGYLDPFHLNCPMGNFQNYIKGAPIATGDLDIHYVQSDQLRNRMSSYENLWMEIFPLTLLTYPGVYTWITLFCILLLCKKKKWKQLTVMLIPVFHILTCMASPVNGYLYPGVYTWITLFCILLLCKKKKWKQLTVMLIPVFHILTCMASPVNGYLRYMLPLMAATPVLLTWTFRKIR